MKRNCYILAVFDCCREKISSRGGGVEAEKPMIKQGNLILIFGCPPELRVSANSTLTSTFFSKLSSCSLVNTAANSLRLPQNLLFWPIPGNGELLIISKQCLFLDNVFTENPSISNEPKDAKTRLIEVQDHQAQIKQSRSFFHPLLLLGIGLLVLLLIWGASHHVMEFMSDFSPLGVKNAIGLQLYAFSIGKVPDQSEKEPDSDSQIPEEYTEPEQPE